MYQTVLFDLDGTLIDHVPAIHRSYVHTMAQLGKPKPTYEQVKGAIGGGLENAMSRFVAKSELPKALAIYREFWDRTMLDGATILPGAVELLQKLQARGLTLTVMTNKIGTSSRELCAHLEIASYFKEIFGAQDTPWLKPAKELSAYVLTALEAKPETACMIGDSTWDIQAAHNGGVVFHPIPTPPPTHPEIH